MTKGYMANSAVAPAPLSLDGAQTFAGPAADRRWLWVLIAVLAAGLALSVTSWRSALADARHARQDAATATEHVAALERARRADAVAIDRAASERDLTRQIESRKNAETEKALTKHMDWAGQPVPADVLVSLRD